MGENNAEEIIDGLFLNLVSSLYSSSMHFMGKMMNPVTGKIEKNLEAARTNIEILRMLREKTRGSLSQEESRMLEDAISNMQLNYVDEVEKAKKEKSGGVNADKNPGPTEETSSKEDEK